MIRNYNNITQSCIICYFFILLSMVSQYIFLNHALTDGVNVRANPKPNPNPSHTGLDRLNHEFICCRVEVLSEQRVHQSVLLSNMFTI